MTGNVTASATVSAEQLTSTDDLTDAGQASNDGTLTLATGSITDSDTSISEWANYYMDHLYYLGSIALVGCLIAMEAGTGINVVETANTMSYSIGLIWNGGDGTGAACIAYNEEDVAQTLNAVQLYTVAVLVLANTMAAPFTSASFALAMGITAGTEASNYLKKQSEADKIWKKFEDSQKHTEDDDTNYINYNNYNNIQTEALKHRDTAAAYSICTIAMCIVAVGAFAATGPVAPATFLIVSILTVGLSVCCRYIAQNNKASKKYDYDHFALRQLKEIEGTLPALIPTSTCQNIKRYLTCCFFSKPDTTIDDAKIEKIKKLKEITKELKQMIKDKEIKGDDITGLIEDINKIATNINSEGSSNVTTISRLETKQSHATINAFIDQYNKLIGTATLLSLHPPLNE